MTQGAGSAYALELQDIVFRIDPAFKPDHRIELQQYERPSPDS